MKEYKMIQMRKEVHQELKEYCIKNGHTISGLVEKLVLKKLELDNVKIDKSKVLKTEPRKDKYMFS